MSSDITRSIEAGATRGREVGSWVIDGNTTAETCERIIKGYDEGDPEIMDMMPAPLSGEDAGSSIPEIFGSYVDEEMMDAYEEAFQTMYWQTVLEAARANLPDDVDPYYSLTNEG